MSWLEEYLASLAERDFYESQHNQIYRDYEKVANRTLSHEDDSAAHQGQDEAPESEKGEQTQLQSPKPPSSRNNWQEDLREAQRARSEMQRQVDGLNEKVAALSANVDQQNKQITDLNQEQHYLNIRLKDRNEEIKGKAKLLEDIHDETVALTLQLNVSEEQNQKLRAENKELIDRWMERMGREADAMNVQSEFS